MVAQHGTGDEVLDRVVNRVLGLPSGPPGVCLAVSSAGATRWSAGGCAQVFDDAGPLPVPPAMSLHSRTDLGSVTKIAAATMCLMRLVDSGVVGLAARLDELLPWMAGRPAAAATLTELLEHRAGLWEWWPTYLAPEDPFDVVSSLALRYPPGQGRHYSDLGFMLLGAAISAVAGEPLADAVSRLVLEPLGLSETSYARPVPGEPVAASSVGDAIEQEMIRSGRPYPVTAEATGFTYWRRHVLVGEVNDGNAFHSFESVAGHAGLFSTPADLLRLGDGLLRCLSGDEFCSRPTAALFLAAGADPGQALGFRRWSVLGTEALGHTGFPGIGFAVLPRLGLSVAMVTNRLHVRGTPVATEPLWLEIMNTLVEEGVSSWT